MARKLFDVDGVAADFQSFLLESVSLRLEPEDIKTYDIFNYLNDEERRLAYRLLDDPEFWEAIPVKDGAIEGIRFLRDLGHDIVWVTAPWDSCEGWDVARRSWLERKFQANREDIVITAGKVVVSGADFVDDKPSNVRDWQAGNSGRAWIFDAPYNRDFSWPHRFSWDKVERLG